MAKSPKVSSKVNSISTTKMALATVAMVVAAGASLVGVPANNNSSSPRPECIPLNIEFSQPCNAVVAGQPGTVPGFRRMRYVCPGTNTGLVSVGSCRTQQKMYTEAAMNCQRRNQCSLVGYGYGYIPEGGYGYGYDQIAAQQVTVPSVAWSVESPSYLGPQFVPGRNSLVAKLTVSNSNNVPMYLDSMNIDVLAAGFTSSSLATRYLSVYDESNPNGRVALGQWRPTFTANPDHFSFPAQQFSRIMIPAQRSKTLIIKLDTQGLQGPSLDPLDKELAIKLPENFLGWTVGAQTGERSSLNSSSMSLISAGVNRPEISWSAETPSGQSAPNAEQIIAKINVWNSVTGEMDPQDLELNRLQIHLDTTIPIGQQRMIYVYKDAINPANRVGSLNLNVRNFYSNQNMGLQNFAVGPGRYKTLIITYDTSAARVDDYLSISIPRDAIGWRKGAISSDRSTGLPLSPKIFTY